MKIINNYSDLESHSFEGELVKGVTGRVAIGVADGAPHFCMRVFTIKPDGFTPRHAHDWEHEILFHSGSGQIVKDGAWCDVSAGSIAFVPGNEEHQIRNNSSADLVFACLIPKGAPEL
ncbi:MAG: cupin domain-containing protein [Desulfofustis sp.]|nr:cupin domain-containing protein [Desulfofustis sp.]